MSISKATIFVDALRALSSSVLYVDSNTTLQAAINTLSLMGGGTVVIHKTISVNTEIIWKRNVNLVWMNKAKILWTGSRTGTVLQTDPTDVPRTNAAYGLFIDVGSDFEGTALHLHSSVSFYFDKLDFIMSGPTSKVIVLSADSSGGEEGQFNRNCGAHWFGRVHAEGVYGTLIETYGVSPGYNGSAQVVTLNTFAHLFALDGRGVSINLKNWTDSNTFVGSVRVGAEANNAMGIQHGDGGPGVYNNIFTGVTAVDNFDSATGRVAVKIGDESKLLKIYALYNRPEAEGGVVVAGPAAISYDVTHMRDTDEAGSNGDQVQYQRKRRIAGEGFNGSSPVILQDDTIATYNMAEGGAQENSYATFVITCSDPESSCTVWVNPRRTSGGPQIKLIAPAAADCEVAVGTGPLTDGSTDGVDTKFNVHVTDDGTVIMKNRRGAPVSIVYAPLAWFQGD